MQFTTGTVTVTPMSVKELADAYGVSPRIMKRWLMTTESSAGRRRGRFFTSNQVVIIYRILGAPGAYTIAEDQ